MLWLEWRAHIGKPLPPSIMGHVIINEEDMQEFEQYSDDNVPKHRALMPYSDLLALWYTKVKCITPTLHLANGLMYMSLSHSQVDEVITWIEGMQRQYHQQGELALQ